MSAWEDVLLDSGDQRKPAEWWWAYVTDVDPLRIRRELETHPLGSTPSTIEANLQIGDKVRVVNYLGQALIVGRAGGPRPQRWAGASFAEAAGIATIPIGVGWNTITLPANRFTVPPIVVPYVASGAGSSIGVTLRARNATTSSFQVHANDTAGRGGDTTEIGWHAIQMTPTSASG